MNQNAAPDSMLNVCLMCVTHLLRMSLPLGCRLFGHLSNRDRSALPISPILNPQRHPAPTAKSLSSTSTGHFNSLAQHCDQTICSLTNGVITDVPRIVRLHDQQFYDSGEVHHSQKIDRAKTGHRVLLPSWLRDDTDGASPGSISPELMPSS